MNKLIAIIAAAICIVGFALYGLKFIPSSTLVSSENVALPNSAATKIKWRPWDNNATFKEADKNEKLVFLFLSPEWCDQGREMEMTSLSADTNVYVLNRFYVPVKVDPDANPEINERYHLAGYPSCVILTPDGKIVGGTAYQPADSLSKFLTGLNLYWFDHRDRVYNQANHLQKLFVEATTKLTPTKPNEIILVKSEEAVKRLYDSTYAGFNLQPKFILPDVNEYMFSAVKEGGVMMFKDEIIKTLDAQLALLDTVWGGFYRYSAFADWSGISHEKLLSDNALILSNYIDAYQITKNDKYKDAAELVIKYLDRFLKSDQGAGFYNSQQGLIIAGGKFFDPVEYWKKSDKDRTALGAPGVDKSMYVESNCYAISAYLKAMRALGRNDCGEYAIKTLELIRDKAEGSEGGMYHDVFNHKSTPFGLLSDQIACMQALIDGYQTIGKKTYLSQAERIAHFVVSRLSDPNSHAFNFEPSVEGRIGRLGVVLQPFTSNCAAVTALMKLSYLTGNSKYKDQAEDLVRYLFSVSIREDDLRLCKMANAYLWRYRYPAKFVIVGKHGDAYTQFQENLWKLYFPREIIVPFETGKDKLQLGELTFPPSDKPMLFLCSENLCSPPMDDPSTIADQIKEFLKSK